MRFVREHALALVALTLAVVGLASGGSGKDASRIGVLVASRAIAADTVVRPDSVRVVMIAATDRTPGMATLPDEIVGRTARVRLSAGDYILRSAARAGSSGIVLRPGERAVPLSVEPSAAPPLALLRAGAHVDVVAEHDADRNGPARSELIARNLTLLVGARATDDGIVATVRAPLEVALTLATAQAQAHRLRLFALPVRVGDG